jgi:hypothetical protein
VRDGHGSPPRHLAVNAHRGGGGLPRRRSRLSVITGRALIGACAALLLAAAILSGLPGCDWAALACALAGIGCLVASLAFLRGDGNGGAA